MDERLAIHEQGSAADTARLLRRKARDLWASNDLEGAYAAAWGACDRGDRESKAALANFMDRVPLAVGRARRADYLKLLSDPEVEPNLIVAAGWRSVMKNEEDAAEVALPDFAARCERDALILELLRQAPVTLTAAERLMTRLRGWLLLSGLWREHPGLAQALQMQAGLNGGAWPFSAEERRKLAEADSAGFADAYLPYRPSMSIAPMNVTNQVTRAVTAQYESYPYPAWTRITRHHPKHLRDVVRKIDPALAMGLPVAANILIAGCGSGRQAASVADRYPDAIVTAIDVSQPSLDYARKTCARLGLRSIRFERMDLHDVGALGQRFDCIHCEGVLHHLPDPEHGWKCLVDVLAPGGVMKIMVYKLVSRLRVRAARDLIADLIAKPVDDDVLRQARARIIERSDRPPAQQIVRSRDFATLAGTHDLLMHRHEDPFDLPRIARAIETLGLRLLQFDLPTAPANARYSAAVPSDPDRQDLDAWRRYESANPGLDLGNYVFWCARTSRM